MKIRIDTLIDLHKSIIAIRQHNTIDFKLAWRLSDVENIISVHTKRAEEEQNNLLNEYGTPDTEKIGSFNIGPENIGLYVDSINKINSYEVNIDLPKFEKDDFESIKFTPDISINAIRLLID